MKQMTIGLLLTMVLAALTNAESITDPLCRDLPVPTVRTANSFNLTYDAGWGTDPLAQSDSYLAVTSSANPASLYYTAGTGYYFDHFTVSFASMNGQCVFDLYDAKGVQIPVTPVWDHNEADGAIKWYTITVYADDYDFRQILIQVWGPAGCGAIGTVELEKTAIYITSVTDPLNRDLTAPSVRSSYIHFNGNYDTTWQDDPLVSSVDPYVFTGVSGQGNGYISYAVPSGEYISKLTASIAYLGGANAVEIRDSGYNRINFTTTAATQDANGVWWYTVSFDRANNTGSDIDYLGLYIVVYGGSWGLQYSSVGTVVLEKQKIVDTADQNASFDVPAIDAIDVDGSLADWSNSTDWSQPYTYWNGDEGLSSTTRAKFAWNDAQDLLYVAIETDECGQPGGHAVLGFSKDIHSVPTSGIGSTQLCFDPVKGTGNMVLIQNEIDCFTTQDSSLGWPHAGTDGVEAAYSYDEPTGKYIYEIATPLRTDWRVDHMLSTQTLSAGDVIYLYSVLENQLNGGIGMDLTYYGNPKFYAGAFSLATALTLKAPASTRGDFNGDGLVNAKDIDLLSAAIKTPNPDSKFDLTGEGLVNSADMDVLVKDILKTYYGDADLNHSVGVSDLSVLAAYYNTPSGASWANGDFDGNGAVGVSDLSILAANYNSGSASMVSWAEAYAQAFGTTSDADETTDASADDSEDTTSSVCSSLGLSLIAGLALMGLMMVKLEE
jgi:hypothetical protein